ncbi:MAG: chitobiase/beta-hexosaminidase C-terminal domain-containing protein, partial [Planctomycetota bacterium]
GDLNRDCRIDLLDIQILAEQWMEPPEKPADLNGDDSVDMRDLALMGMNWKQAGIPLVINEFMASNNIYQDPQGDTDDWIEIYNYGNEAIDLAGMYLTDDLTNTTMWRFPATNPALTTVGPGDYLVVWADNDTTDVGLHANFKLSANGEEIGLFDSDGVTLIDIIVFDEQDTQISYGRYPDANDNWRFMPFPTPQGTNIGAYQGLVEEVEFSHERGFYDAPFSVTIATETEGASIFYTLDGSEPRYGMPMFYTDPISIDKTTTLRAKAFKSGWKPSNVDTQTYIFLDDVKTQSPNGQAPGPDWPSYNVNGQEIDYGMDPDVVNDYHYRNLMDDALLAIPTISLVTDLDNLFDSSTGIYVNARQDGRAWERPTSVELLNPDGSEGFQINAGLRIRGAFSRSGDNPKHALRLFFRAEYGAAGLSYPLFGSEGVDEFDKIDLRTSQNNSWAFQGSSQNTLIRDVFSRDVQRDMGQPYTRSRYYHLYINGHYWGIYQTQERADADFAESYLNGDGEQYDVIKNDSSGSRALHATNGTMDAYRRLYDAAVAGFDSEAAYFAVQGLRPDGTLDPTGEKLLDPENLMDYMICTYYTGDPDAPVSCWGHFSNNVFAIYNRVQPQGFTWYRHDAEHSLGANGGVNEGRLLTDPMDRSIGQQYRHFNPAWLHLRLTDNPEYLAKFSDRVNKYFENGGILTAAQNIQRWNDRAEQIDLAIIAESARWGDAKTHPPRTKSDWEGQNNYMVNTFFPQRNQIVINQMHSVNMFPNLALVSFNRHGGQVIPGFELHMSQSNGTSGTVYYSVDGNDPGQRVTVQVTTTTLSTHATAKRVLVPTGPVSNYWKGAQAFNDLAWTYSSGSPGGVGYERDSGYQSYISLNVESLMYNRNTTCYIRIPFTVSSDPSEFNFMALNMRYDDGFVAYINGVEVQRVLFSGTPTWNSRADGNHEADSSESFEISEYIGALQSGDNILAIQGLNVSTTSSDFLVSGELVAGSRTYTGEVLTDSAIEYTGPVTLDKTTHVKARVLRDGLWSALTEANFAIGPVAENLRITEIMYHPQN